MLKKNEETRRRLTTYATGPEVLARNGLPEIMTIGQLREVLKIKTPKQLGWFLLACSKNSASNAAKRRRAKLGGVVPPAPYTRAEIPKRNGTMRILYAPNKQLKWVQRRILALILSRLPTHDAAHGFVPGRGTVSNAQPHVGRPLVVKFDLQDFFPTVTYARVLGFFVSKGYPYGDARTTVDDAGTNVAAVLARLCCVAETKVKVVLPQGAPTSPALTNLLCRRFDLRLTALARKWHGAYTRYADDLTFSFPDANIVRIGRLRNTVAKICRSEGFVLHDDKFRVLRSHRRQQIAGIVVNDKLAIPRELRRTFRAMLHNCEKNGVEAEIEAHPDCSRGYLQGFAAYVNMVRPDLGPALLQRVQALLAKSDNQISKKASGG